MLPVWYIKGRKFLSLRRLIGYFFFRAKRKLKLDLSFSPPNGYHPPEKIDVFIPAIEKDAEMLGFCIDSVRKYSLHDITNIYVIAPKKSKLIRQIAKDKDCVFVREEDALPFSKSKIQYKVDGYDRSGWIYKMLINLNADQICHNDNVLILDADTLFIRDQLFIYKKRPLFNLSDEYHQPYYLASERVIGIRHSLSRSFITHYMIFNRKTLRDLREMITKKTGLSWYDGIIENIDTSELSGFADYEIYGDFYTKNKYPRAILNYWSNISLQVDRISEIRKLQNKYRESYGSLSLHHYVKE